jgi:predicted phosphate transport protein (TIGR00153 family)
VPHFLNWVRKEQQKGVLDCSMEHLEKVRETVEELHCALLNAGDPSRLREYLHSVACKEHEADVIRKKLTLDIAKDELIFSGYEDLLEFVHEVDSIADYAHAAGRYLAIFNGTLTDKLSKLFVKMVEIGCESMKKVCSTVRNFGKVSKEDTLISCSEIETLEEQGDDLKRELLLELFKSDYTPAHLIILRDLVEMVEDICDRCEIVAARIRLFVVKMI